MCEPIISIAALVVSVVAIIVGVVFYFMSARKLQNAVNILGGLAEGSIRPGSVKAKRNKKGDIVNLDITLQVDSAVQSMTSDNVTLPTWSEEARLRSSPSFSISFNTASAATTSISTFFSSGNVTASLINSDSLPVTVGSQSPVSLATITFSGSGSSVAFSTLPY